MCLREASSEGDCSLSLFLLTGSCSAADSQRCSDSRYFAARHSTVSLSFSS